MLVCNKKVPCFNFILYLIKILKDFSLWNVKTKVLAKKETKHPAFLKLQSCDVKQSNATRETLQTVSVWQTEWWPRPVWWICDRAAWDLRAWLSGWGLALMVCLITCTATQQIISQAGTLGLTCHQETNNPPTRSQKKGKRYLPGWVRLGQAFTRWMEKCHLRKTY